MGLILLRGPEKDILGQPPGSRSGGVPRPPARKPGTVAHRLAGLLPLDEIRPPGARRSSRRAYGQPAPRLPRTDPRPGRAAAAVPPLDHRSRRPPARGAGRPARAAARHPVTRAAPPHGRRRRRQRAYRPPRAPPAPGPPRPGDLAGAAAMP